VITDSVVLAGSVTMRPAEPGDAAALCLAFRRNRGHLRPWDPDRGEEFYTVEAQQGRLRDLAVQRDAGRTMSWLLVEGDTVVGSIMLSSIARGPLSSAVLGYWIDAGHTGRGLATAAAGRACSFADEQLGLHRLEAGTLPSNSASQAVLAKCGFVRYGLAPRYLHIAGQWRDHVLFQKILNDLPPR
jgi:[ribosomal protein S5]-alanine N-acetyltransferase